MPSNFSKCALCLLLSAAFANTVFSQPYGGTVWLNPNLITDHDPTTFSEMQFAGTGDRLMFDRRINGWTTLNVFLFNAIFSDGLSAEIQVNPEFGSMELAEVEARFYSTEIGRLPTALRSDLQTVWIHQGFEAFGSGNNNLLIHTGSGAQVAQDGFLGELFFHEAAHTSLDAQHALAPDWLAAQNADPNFISTYARDNPFREDIAESFLPWFAVRYRADRLSIEDFDIINTTIPNRLEYFDRQNFNMYPIVVPEPSAALMLLISGTLAALRRRRAPCLHGAEN